ncbi:MAG: ABC transporter ATP-binding protein [Eubacterium sp.]|nr:ABC transporter ATP-binding protein [Eubacterium sp.]
MNVKEKPRGVWKRTFSLFGKVRIPWHLYVLQVIAGIIVTRVGLLYVPYESKLQTGKIEDITVLLGYLGFSLLFSAVSLLEHIPSFYASAEVTRNLQNRMISRSLYLPMKAYEQSASRIVSWITQDCSYASGFITSLVGFITGIAATWMSIAEMSEIDSSLLFIVPIICVYVVVSTWVEGKLMFLRERRGRRAMSELTAYMAEHIGFFRQIKQMNTEKQELERGKKAIDLLYRADIYQATMTLLILLVSGSVSQMMTILVFVFGIAKVQDGSMDITQLAAFNSYILIAYQSFSSITGVYSSIMYYNGSLFYIGGLMSEKEEVYKRGESMDREDEDIIFDNVSFSYDDVPVIKDASFTIPKGKVTMIAGPNGSGKTTLFKLIERFYTPDEGVIRFGDSDAENIHLDEWRKSFGYVLQEPQLFDGTVRDNITYGTDREVSEEEVQTAARLAQADEFINEFAEGYDYEIGENGINLSAGQKQRLAIARALITDPSYLLLDECTCNMDVRTEHAVNDALFKVMKGKTVVMICHDMRMLKNADNVIVLRDGKVEASGERETVLQTSETLKKLVAANV